MLFSKSKKEIEKLIYFYDVWKYNPVVNSKTTFPDYEYHFNPKDCNKYISVFEKEITSNPTLTRESIEDIKNSKNLSISSLKNFIINQKFTYKKQERNKYNIFVKRHLFYNNVNLKESKYLKSFSYVDFVSLPRELSELSELPISISEYNKSIEKKEFILKYNPNSEYAGYNWLLKRFYGQTISEKQIEKYINLKDSDEQRYNKYLNLIQNLEHQFNSEKNIDLNKFNTLKADYSSKDPQVINNYLELIIKKIIFPKFSKPTSFKFEYDNEKRVLLFSCNLPNEDKFIVKKYKHKKLRKYPFDEIIELNENKTENKKIYENYLYLLPIKIIYEFFKFDNGQLFDFIAFNGNIKSHNKATGILEENTIMSLFVEKEKILKLNLKHIDPKECFKSLKGISANKLNELVPIKPVLNFKKDKRVVQSKEVIDNLKDQNLASMNWEDFEHLIRELFAKVFSSEGTEVKITQASRDKGVDALVFDPDPIRGGKFVIQAKRYTANVDVAAVRDLYGTILNEGANRGILVTTAKYGSDSYDFAKDKPITLLEGNELLGLLQQHGYHFKIDINEARKFLNLTTKKNY